MDDCTLRGPAYLLTCCAALLAVACGGGDGNRDDPPANGSGIVTAVGTGEDGSDDDGDALDSSEGGIALDIGSAGDGGAEPGCRRVDFLFVVDNSASMEPLQAALVAAFPGFIATIQATLTAEDDYRILVTDTDDWGRCDTANPWIGVNPESDLCNDYINQTVFDECDRTLGAGVVHPAGDFATNGACPLAGGARWMTAAEPDLGASFACVAQVGVAGNPAERPMDAMVAALAPGINAGDGCNDGFLRDDALLVITFLSNDQNYEDSGTPDTWTQAVLDAKGGDASAIVVLGLTPYWDGCGEPDTMPNGAHWAEFVGKWGDHGLHGNICGTAEEFVTFFESAVSTIDAACDDYVPG